MGKMVIAALLGMATVPVQAQEWPAYSAEKSGSPAYQRCKAASHDEASETNCLAEEYKRQDRAMENAYVASLTGTEHLLAERAARIKAQRSWITFRRDNCGVRMKNRGSGAGNFYWSCMVRETIQRRHELSENWDH